MTEQTYAGFWIRSVAALIDTVLIMLLLFPALTIIYGRGYWLSESLTMGPLDIIMTYVLPAIIVLVFWVYKSATPGKMVFKLIIVDAKTGAKPSLGQCVGRYIGYYVAMIPLFLGVFWVGFDKRKQGWHDKLSGTVVVKKIS